jgi:nicotinic acid mononucleotide adenylyltransferase
MDIAVYSGSFNPLHIGHLAIMKYLIGEGGFDCVYLIVSPKNPLKDGISADSGRYRYNAAVEAVSRHFPETGDAVSGKVKVDDIESDHTRHKTTNDILLDCATSCPKFF